MNVETRSGEIYPLQTEVTRVIDFVIESQDILIEETSLDGADGYIDHGVQFKARKMTLTLATFDDPIKARRRIFKIFNSKEQIYLSDFKDPGRKWKCRVNGAFTPERLPNGKSRFEIPLICGFPYAESNFSTVEQNRKEYTFTKSKFTVINKGDIEINPRIIHTPLLITFKGASTYLEIINKTNGDTWRYDEVTKSDDIIEIIGVRSLKNGESIFRDTNRKLIMIETGDNDFEIKNTSGVFEISFEFKEYTI